MDMNSIKQNYNDWRVYATEDKEVVQELTEMQENTELLYDAFYRDLSFGTGGLRGVIGAGTNRINIYTVRKTTQALANYIKKNFTDNKWKVAISYDSRIKSNIFSEIVAEVLAANKILVYIYDELMPTPCLSFAVRELDCVAGVMITASHNSFIYNGYKIYGDDGGQITNVTVNKITNEMQNINIFHDIQKIDFSIGIQNGQITYIDEGVIKSYVDNVKQQSLLDENINKDIRIVYTPLHGAGLKPILRVLKESGYENINVVKAQMEPDGNFTTCPIPNPEEEQAMKLGLDYAKKINAELLIATDPDSDRVGAAVQNNQGEYILLSGNEIGLLLFDYICMRRNAINKMPDNPIVLKTIVTTDMIKDIANHYSVNIIDVLTGFKYIGEKISLLEKNKQQKSFIFGLEESFGYLSGDYVRDKDAINATLLICEMLAYYKSKTLTLYERLEELYMQYGYYYNSLHSYEFEGAIGNKKIKNIMDTYRSGISEIANYFIENIFDYLTEINELPKSDVLQFVLKDIGSIVIRPSGTEPKLKIYISVKAETREKAILMEKAIFANIEENINTIVSDL